MDGQAVEEDHRRVSAAGAIAVLPVELPVGGRPGPAGDLGRVEPAQTGQAWPVRRDEDHPAGHHARRGRVEDAGREVEVGRPGPGGELVEPVARAVVIDAADDQVDIGEFGMRAGRGEPAGDRSR